MELPLVDGEFVSTFRDLIAVYLQGCEDALPGIECHGRLFYQGMEGHNENGFGMLRSALGLEGHEEMRVATLQPILPFSICGRVLAGEPLKIP